MTNSRLKLLIPLLLVCGLQANEVLGAELLNADEDGLSVNESSALPGYALVAPMNSTTTYLIDNDARIVNKWESEYTPAMCAYLLPDGNLLRPGAEQGGMRGGPGAGGRIQLFNWDGDLLWDFSFSSLKGERYSKLRPHHDICPLPNGNILVVCTDPKTKEESIEAGRLPTVATDELQTDAVIEIKPVGKDGAEVVWEWRPWDHLIQDVHDQKANYGDVTEHPELIDINFVNGMMDRMLQDPKELAKLRSLGYVGGGGGTPPPAGNRPDNGGDRGNRRGGGPPGMGGDWMHVNAVAYNPKLDQVMISVHEFSEVWIIDHSTTTAEAASHSGGKAGKGGDLLYRWGNPRAYRCGTNIDQRLFAQHSAHWIAEGLPGEGNMLVFNNGMRRPDGSYSSADEVELPVNDDGTYQKEEYVAYEPFEATWRYGSPENSAFSSMLISGCQRLPNGNTFICSGNQGILFEVTPVGDIVWQYKHPGAGFDFGGPGGFAAMFGGLVPGFLRPMFGIDDSQGEKIKALEDDADGKLKAFLSDEQFQQLKAPPGPPQPGSFPELRKVGELATKSTVAELDLSSEQEAKFNSLQDEVTKSLNEILTKEQRERINQMEKAFAQGGPPNFGGGPPGFGPPGFGPPPGGGPGQGGGPPFGGFGTPGGDRRGGPPGRRGPGGPGGGPGGPGGIFRAYKYAADYPGLVGKDLTPGELLDEISAQAPPAGRRDGRPPRPDRGTGRPPLD